MKLARTFAVSALCAALTSVLAAVLAPRCPAQAASDKMEIVAIDLLGKNTGEAAMISGSGGTPLLLDSGDNNNRSIFDWLNANGDRKSVV